MALTQKKVKEQIVMAEQMIEDTAKEKDDLLKLIKQYRDESNNIDIKKDEKIIEAVEELNGLMQTITYYNGYLNSLEWTLEEMKTKSKKKEG